MEKIEIHTTDIDGIEVQLTLAMQQKNTAGRRNLALFVIAAELQNIRKLMQARMCMEGMTVVETGGGQ